MTLYNNRTFTIAPSGSYDQAHAMCRRHGHMEPDQRGKCLRCGEKAESSYGRSVVEDIMDRAEVLARSDAEATELGRS